jgi:hypothetical protein
MKLCPLKPPIEFGKPKPKECGGTIHLYPGETDADDYERCDTCGAVWSRDSKE